MTNTSTMRALILDDYETAQFRSTQIDKPSAGPGEVLVRIKTFTRSFRTIDLYVFVL